MNKFLKPIALIGLLLTILPAILLISGVIDLPQTKNIMIAGMIIWYGAAIPWIGFSKN